jgi:hypothetical protein
MTDFSDQELILKAAIEFGSLYTYEIKHGTLGKTLYIDAINKEEASVVRKMVGIHWNGLYVVVRYQYELDESEDPQKTVKISREDKEEEKK